MVSYFSYSSTDTVCQLSNDDDSEKEEKKIESEYFIDLFFAKVHLNLFSLTEKKIIIPDHAFKLTYIPEVLTPPPLV